MTRLRPFPPDPVTLGEHLRKRRHELGLFQKEAAAQLGVNPWTLIGWEQDRKQPMIRMWPRVIKFLGCYLFPQPQSLCERLLGARRRLGVTQEEAAKMASVDETSLRLWELGTRKPSPISLMKIEEFVAASS